LRAMCETRYVINTQIITKSVRQYYSSKANGRSAIQETYRFMLR